MSDATVEIGGLVIGESLDDPTTVFGIAKISIQWGRDSIHDDIKADVLEMQVVDHDGDWSLDSNRIGEAVIVTRHTPTKRIVFRGRVTDSKCVRRIIRGRQYWLTTITAASTVAEAETSKPLGPGWDDVAQYLNATENVVIAYRKQVGGWPYLNINTRLEQLWTYGLSKFFKSATTAITFSFAASVPQIRSFKYSEAPNLLEHLAAIYRLYKYGWPQYDPDSESLTLATLTTTAGVQLTTQAGKLTTRETSGNTAPAKAFALDAIEIESNVRDAISTVNFGYSSHPQTTRPPEGGITYAPEAITGTTSAPNGSRGSLSIETLLDCRRDATGANYTNLAPEPFLQPILEIINTTLNANRIPALEFSATKTTGNTALDDLLLSTLPLTTPIYFQGSFFNGRKGIADFWHLIGGKLTFDEHGWRNRYTPSPCTPTGYTTTTLAALCTNTTYSLADFEETVTVGDLTTVTIGLT